MSTTFFTKTLTTLRLHLLKKVYITFVPSKVPLSNLENNNPIFHNASHAPEDMFPSYRVEISY